MKIAPFALFVVIALSGCAATVKQQTTADIKPLAIPAEAAKTVAMNITGSKVSTEAKDWEQLKGEWRAAMKAATAEAGVKYMEQEIAVPTNEPGTLVTVHVNDYRYLSSGARYGFGVMTGNAYMNSQVRFTDLKSGRPYGERTYNTSSSAWEGIFSAMTAKQIEAICKQIVAEIEKR
jgi:hypothetical protein